MNVLKTLFFLSLGLIIFQTCSKDEISTTSSNHQPEEERLTIQEELLRTVKASSEDGVLYFDNSPDFHRALDVLDTISLDARKTWESELGFTSLRSVYEEVLEAFLNDEEIDQSLYRGLISFDRDYPYLINHTSYVASVLNEYGVVSIHGMLGSLSYEGCFWVKGGSVQDVKTLISTKEHDPENGVLSYNVSRLRNNNGRTCTEGIPTRYEQIQEVSDGDNRGSSRLRANAIYSYTVTPGSGDGSLEYIRVLFRMRGVSERKGRRKWSSDRTDHIFSWKFTINHQIVETTPTDVTVLSETLTDY